MIHRFLCLSVLLCMFVGIADAQKRRELEKGRQRGWTPQQVQRWVDHVANKPMTSAARLECEEEFARRRDVIMNGNRITSQILNFGSISSPGNTITDIVWNGLGYGFEFGPFVAAEIIDENREDPQSVPLFDDEGRPVLDDSGQQVFVTRIVSDGLVSNGGEVSPDGTEFWGWQPIACAEPVGAFDGLEVVDANSPLIPTSDAKDTDLDGKPDSWPESWFNENLGEYVWPGALQQGASNADKEALYFMNDYNNAEFLYRPFDSDPSISGLGLEVETRIYQWANPLAEDAMFLIYKITNKSEKDLDKVIFGMWGDPHVGGPGDWPDDLADFDRDLNMVFASDADGRSDIPGRVPGVFGYKFLESPGIGNEIINGQFFPGDGIDNDGDGMIDESWTDGIDNDNDWVADLHDVGIDGIDGTGDEGEGDGLPTAGSQFDITKPGEPNYEFTDIDESDQIGLTSFASPAFAGNRISNDERVWELVQPGRFEDIPAEPGDYVFIYGSGSFPLRAGETKRFSIALIVGERREDLELNANTVQEIFDAGYRFAKPPDKPIVKAVAGDQKVTLYWDDAAEKSVDPISGLEDFEGYVIYRSTDHEFSDQQTITDINGSKFLFSPLLDENGVEAKFDLINGQTGPSPFVYPRRGIAYDLGDDTGIFHTYVDSNNVINGQTYYYTVVAYDRGWDGMNADGQNSSDELAVNGIPPSETSKTITFNPNTNDFIFDVNTVAVTPGPRVAGFRAPIVNNEEGRLTRVQGSGTGNILIDVIDEFAVPDNGQYSFIFDELDDEVMYSIRDDIPKQVTVNAEPGKTSGLGFQHIDPSSLQVVSESGAALVSGQDFQLTPESGSLQITGNVTGRVTASFNYFPLYQSSLLNSEEANTVFDGFHVFVQDVPLAIDDEQTGWSQGGDGLVYEVRVATSGPGREPQPSDYEVVFSDQPQSNSVSTNIPLPFTITNITQANQPIQAFTPDINGNGEWDLNESIIFVESIDGDLTATWEVRVRDSSRQPTAGDVLFVGTSKPFTGEDQFSFTTTAATTDPEEVAASLRDIYVVPNPYVATNVFEPRNPVNRAERGDRRLYFANVPQQCTIRIYTLSGELVDTIEHNGGLDEGKAFWDLRSSDNLNIAYGLYLFHVESEEGAFTGKFAIIK